MVIHAVQTPPLPTSVTHTPGAIITTLEKITIHIRYANGTARSDSDNSCRVNVDVLMNSWKTSKEHSCCFQLLRTKPFIPFFVLIFRLFTFAHLHKKFISALNLVLKWRVNLLRENLRAEFHVKETHQYFVKIPESGENLLFLPCQFRRNLNLGENKNARNTFILLSREINTREIRSYCYRAKINTREIMYFICCSDFNTCEN